jgi:hypothetical protein
MSLTIGAGITLGNGIIIEPAPTLVLSLDAAGYTSGPWVDSISSRSFTLNGGVSYSSDGGGSLVFVPASSQYAECTSSLSDLNTWTVEAWHYYDETNSGGSPCIVTEVYPGITGQINYALGNQSDSSPNLQTGWWNGSSWQPTPQGYTLTAGNWYQIVGTYNGAQNSLYVNNTLVGQANATGTAISSQGGIRLMSRWDSNQYWGGKLAIVKIYQGAMTSNQINTNWNTNKARFGL